MDIRQAQVLIKNRFYEKDATRGLYSTFTWLVEEVGELAEALIKLDRSMLEEELADVLAWLLSVANLVNIDLEDAFIKKYMSDETKASS